MDNSNKDNSSSAPVASTTDEISPAETVAAPADDTNDTTVVADSDMETTAPLANPEPSSEEPSSSDETDATESEPPSANEPVSAPPTEDEAAAAAANTMMGDAAAAPPPTESDGASTSARDRADRVSTENPILQEIRKYSEQLSRIIMICRRKLFYNSQARDTIIRLDAILARTPSQSPSSYINTMLDIYKSLIANVPGGFELFDIEATTNNVFRFYNLENMLASRVRHRRSTRLASKRRRQQNSNSNN